MSLSIYQGTVSGASVPDVFLWAGLGSPKSAHQGSGGLNGFDGDERLLPEAIGFLLCLYLAWHGYFIIMSCCVDSYWTIVAWITSGGQKREAADVPALRHGCSTCSTSRHAFLFDSIRLEWFGYIRSFVISCPIADSNWNIAGRQEVEGVEDFSADYHQRGPKRKQVYLWQCVSHQQD
ncbi:hypothetical protein CMUS01_07973 [Colletotrichum musicola]|uniref:Uncharacterized protein n=1 Tax=Colletotrichum musicola TaxID=2175873 RepID=A0A8H6KF68_9PEZI|nr:hypothetical protein CMUS01_07973 [Colletotrichum musicola]